MIQRVSNEYLEVHEIPFPNGMNFNEEHVREFGRKRRFGVRGSVKVAREIRGRVLQLKVLKERFHGYMVEEMMWRLRGDA